MATYKHHLDLANERFSLALEQFEDEKYHTAAHLFINAAINYHSAICQKFLNKISRHKPHSDTSYFYELAGKLGEDLPRYRAAYEFLMGHKSDADYGNEFSQGTAKQVFRRTKTIKEIAETIL